jgi:Tfp pilus assembly protein PilO
MELEQLTSKQKGKFFNLLLLVLFIFISYQYIYKKQAAVFNSLQSKKNSEIKINEVLKNIIALEGNLDSYRNFLLKDSSQIINRISDIAKENGIELASITPSSEQKSADYIQFPYDFTINAPDFHALGKFIGQLESNKDIYIVDYMAIRGNDRNKQLHVNLKISAVGDIN